MLSALPRLALAARQYYTVYYEGIPALASLRAGMQGSAWP